MKDWHKEASEEIRIVAADRLQLPAERLRHIGGFENVIYEYLMDSGSSGILRISHSSHRSEEQLASEQHWVRYLASEGVSVCRPLLFPSGSLLERIDRGEGYFTLTLWDKAPGRKVRGGCEEWGPELFEAWGELTGSMHALTKKYTVPAGVEPRSSADPNLYQPSPAWPKEKLDVWEKYKETESLIQSMDRTPDIYGLCHRDLHNGNFFVDEGTITAFDFDDAGYDFFVHDIAIAVYYSSVFGNWGQPETDSQRISEFAGSMLRRFMTGYRRKHEQAPGPWARLPLFIERRRCELCLILFDAWSRPNANDQQRQWLESNVYAIRNGDPCMELGWIHP
ncbi:phosphotransferase [Paenibacillus filicis]|uniref:Phosphotransferase n=1 Tax=Paenibacillus gyeongsangnamensis TaxID=3388067 RepID=A0ABT4Q5I4_9BACL|nr:phosphotransferase [Paenibacillus filicis]MCZ8512133.1 phosphotransferase [Paenibacillus filicis]